MKNTTKVKVTTLGALMMIALSFGCAHQATDESQEGQSSNFEYENTPPMTGGKIFAPFAIMYQLGKIPADRSPKIIWGQCHVIERDETSKQTKDAYPCPETFVEVKRVGETVASNIWIDATGAFEFPFKKGETYQLKAVCERYSVASAEITVNRPGKISLTINRLNSHPSTAQRP